MAWPAVRTATSSEPPPTTVSAPRRDSIGVAGLAATNPFSSGGSDVV